MGTTGALIRWSSPDSEASWTHARVYSATNEGGPYSQIAEQVISDTTYWDVNGTTNTWYRITFYDNVALVESDPSEPMQAGQYRGYSTITEIRRYTNVQSTEFDNDAIQQLIDDATQQIDTLTKRSWQGYNVVTDEYYDIEEATDTLYLNQYDIYSLDQIEVLTGTDRSSASSWTEITSSKVLVYADQGKLVIDGGQSPEETCFPAGSKTVRVSYQWGIRDPTYDVRHLCTLMVANMINMDETRQIEINSLLKTLARKGMTMP